MGPHAVTGPYPPGLSTRPLPLGSGGRLALASLSLGVTPLLSGQAILRRGSIEKAAGPVSLAPEQDGPPERFVPRHGAAPFSSSRVHRS